MARVWFVRRRGGQWVAPGGRPVVEAPLAALIFPLDLGTHRLVPDERPVAAPELAAEPPESLQRVFVEVEAADLSGAQFSGYEPGIYDSPYSPAAVARRLGPHRGAAAEGGRSTP